MGALHPMLAQTVMDRHSEGLAKARSEVIRLMPASLAMHSNVKLQQSATTAFRHGLGHKLDHAEQRIVRLGPRGSQQRGQASCGSEAGDHLAKVGPYARQTVSRATRNPSADINLRRLSWGARHAAARSRTLHECEQAQCVLPEVVPWCGNHGPEAY
jgi:hypothetical protein